LRCLCVLTSQYGIAYYMTKHTLLNGTVLLNSAPLFIPLLEWIFLGHRPGKSTIVGALVAFLGVLLVLKPDRSLFTALVGVGLLAALGQAGSQVLYGLKSKSENLLASLFYLFLFTTLFASLVLLLDIDFGHVPLLCRLCISAFRLACLQKYTRDALHHRKLPNYSRGSDENLSSITPAQKEKITNHE
jgi:drug/metabolite transporter (DMT)-like permease